ncbi:hypothetical protein L249_1636, partial [Ophiocordyceps polyrhachis-furcata BCC 54312]
PKLSEILSHMSGIAVPHRPSWTRLTKHQKATVMVLEAETDGRISQHIVQLLRHVSLSSPLAPWRNKPYRGDLGQLGILLAEEPPNNRVIAAGGLDVALVVDDGQQIADVVALVEKGPQLRVVPRRLSLCRRAHHPLTVANGTLRLIRRRRRVGRVAVR